MTSFMDAFALIAWLDTREANHARVAAHLGTYAGRFVTTEWILMELADAFSPSRLRGYAVEFLKGIRTNKNFAIVPFDAEVYDAGFDLYSQRPDKNWSLTDCISFVVMDQFKLIDAMTEDHHFRQAGFNPIFENRSP